MLLRFFAPLLLIFAVSLGPAHRAAAATITFTAELSGANEEPANTSPGIGFAKVMFDSIAHLLSIEITFADLLAPVTVAHIHAPTLLPFAGNVGVAVQPGTLVGFPAGVTAGTYSTGIDTLFAGNYTAGFISSFGRGTVAGAEAALLEAMMTGKAYVNIHTSAYPAGEIRGFLQPVAPIPLPASLPLLLVGLAGLAAMRRARRS